VTRGRVQEGREGERGFMRVLNRLMRSRRAQDT
jgi:hypothetical protein